MISIPSSLLISLKEANDILTPKDWAAADNDTSLMQEKSAVPVRVTLQGDAQLVNMERITEYQFAYGDVGKKTDFNGEQVTFDALLLFGRKNKSAFAPALGQLSGTYAYLALLPMSQQYAEPKSIEGYVNESFDLKFTYLPCPLNTVAGKKYPAQTGTGYAYIDTTNQTIVDLVVDNNVLEEQAGQLIATHPDNIIKVACVFANGGCNFTKVIKV